MKNKISLQDLLKDFTKKIQRGDLEIIKNIKEFREYWWKKQ
jgi:hypothetical protein